MNEYDIAEQAYKNGYKAGVKDTLEKILNALEQIKKEGEKTND